LCEGVKAIEIAGPGTLVVTERASRPLIGCEARLAVAVTCVCGSDLKNVSRPLVVPQVPGHEFSGVVVEVAAEALDIVRPGDRVTAFPMVPCRACAACGRQQFRDCPRKQSLGVQVPGSFAEEVVIDSRLLVRLPDALTYEQGALVEHLSCGYRLAAEVLAHQVSLDAHILVIGDGPIALADVQVLRVSGFDSITLIGKHPKRMAFASTIGASRTFDHEDIDAVTAIGLVDVCIMSAPADVTLERLSPLLRQRSLFFPQTRVTSPSATRALVERNVRFGRAFAYELADFTEVMRLMVDGRLETAALVTRRIRLLDAPGQWPLVEHKADDLKTVLVNEGLNDRLLMYQGTA
jgi:threonine dehydrogenase-like Zn-dependent dehydrogenase